MQVVHNHFSAAPFFVLSCSYRFNILAFDVLQMRGDFQMPHEELVLIGFESCIVFDVWRRISKSLHPSNLYIGHWRRAGLLA